MPLRPAAGAPCSGLESDVGSKLEHSRAAVVVCRNVRETHRTGGADTRPGNEAAWGAPVLVVEDVQCLCLKSKPEPLSEGNSFCERHIVVPDVRSVKPRVESQRSRGGVLTNSLKERIAIPRRCAAQGGVDNVFKGTRFAGRALICCGLEYADGILQ